MELISHKRQFIGVMENRLQSQADAAQTRLAGAKQHDTAPLAWHKFTTPNISNIWLLSKIYKRIIFAIM
jgi:hypothetical protein